MGKKVLKQDHSFPTRLLYADKKFRKIYCSLANTTYISTDDMNNKVQSLKGKTKIELY